MSRRKESVSSCQEDYMPPLEKCPWLVYTHRSKKQSFQTFYNVSEGCCYKKSIPALSEKYIFTCAHGWLLMLEKHQDDCFLLNPFSGHKIELPDWADRSMKCCNLSHPPDHPDCVVVAFSNHPEPCICYCKPGDKEWTMHQNQNQNQIEDHQESDDELKMSCLVASGGKLYGLVQFPRTKILVLEIHDSKVVGVKEVIGDFLKSSLPETNRLATYLLEVDGEVFGMRLSFMGFASKIRYVDVYRLDLENSCWEKVEDLGDRVLFVGNQQNASYCSNASALGLHENSVYIVFHRNKCMYRFDLEDSSITVTQPSSEYFKFWEDTNWIIPTRLDS